MNDEDDVAYIVTHQRSMITKLKNNPAAELLQEGLFGSTRWAQFTLPAEFLSFRSKKKGASEAQRQAGLANIEKNRRGA